MGDVAYLDYAATSAIRPPQVADAVAAYLREVGATPGRGGHRLALEAGRQALACRQRLATLLGIPGDPGRIAFQQNATHALNTALRGVLRSGDVAVRTVLDHNAVRRPLHQLGREGVDVRVVDATVDGRLDEDGLARALDGARLLVLNHVSNVLGTALPVARLTRLAQDAGALVLLDVAQSAGHVPFDVAALGVDMVAITGHKGLLGPQGTGALWIRAGVEIEPLLRGGAGGDSASADMPDALPDRLEAGTLNGPGIAGLLAGLEWLAREDVAAMHRRLAGLKAQLRAAFEDMPRVRVLSPAGSDGAAIVMIDVAGIDAAALATRLDREHGVLTRPGLHCAPEAHELIGTLNRGAVRFSLGWASQKRDVERAVEAVRAVLSGTGATGAGAGETADRDGAWTAVDSRP